MVSCSSLLMEETRELGTSSLKKHRQRPCSSRRRPPNPECPSVQKEASTYICRLSKKFTSTNRGRFSSKGSCNTLKDAVISGVRTLKPLLICIFRSRRQFLNLRPKSWFDARWPRSRSASCFPRQPLSKVCFKKEVSSSCLAFVLANLACPAGLRDKSSSMPKTLHARVVGNQLQKSWKSREVHTSKCLVLCLIADAEVIIEVRRPAEVQESTAYVPNRQ